jgi:uncharacterized linocin/CFP29 family protein
MGMTYNLGNPFGTTVLEWDTMGDTSDARVTMRADVRPDEDLPEYVRKSLPIPIVTKGFHLDIRELEASRKLGNTLRADGAREATRKVSEVVEKMGIGVSGEPGVGLSYGGGSVEGLLNLTNRNTGSLNSDWTNDSARDPVDDITSMKQKLIDANQYGPYVLCLPPNYEAQLDEDYNHNYPSRTIRERIAAIASIERIETLDYLTSSNVVMFSTAAEQMQFVVGFEPRLLEWSAQGGMSFYYVVMAILVPWFRNDQDGNSPVVVFT